MHHAENDRAIRCGLRSDGRQIRSQHPAPANQVDGLLRPSSMTTRPVKFDGESIGGTREGASSQTHLPTRELRITVQAIDRLHPIQPAFRDDIDRSTWHRLLCRLEDQSNHRIMGFPEVDEHQGGAEECSSVDIVSAGMCNTLVLRSIRNRLRIVHGECIDVCTKGNDRSTCGWLRCERYIADQAGSATQHMRMQASHPEPFCDPLGRHRLLAGQLRLAMQHASKRDHLRVHRAPMASSRSSARRERTTSSREPRSWNTVR